MVSCFGDLSCQLDFRSELRVGTSGISVGSVMVCSVVFPLSSWLYGGMFSLFLNASCISSCLAVLVGVDISCLIFLAWSAVLVNR